MGERAGSSQGPGEVAPSVGEQVFGLVVALGGCLAVGALGGLATAGSVETWYPTLEKPGFTPPSWLFAPAWTTLYILMGVAAWRVWRETGVRGAGTRPLGLFAGQLVLNLGWSLIFFGLQQPGWALVEILVLLGLIVATTVAFWRVDRWAGGLMLPYIGWVSFATVLNASIWWLNV